MSPEALIGVELGKSVIQRLLGQGTMGAIYLAAQADRQVAMKVFLPASPLAEADNEVFLRCLEENIARGASLDHPHILTVLSHGRQEQLVYQITPYIAGGSLEALFARTQGLPFVQIQHYLEQLAAAVDYAHTRGILHGDIKASNILLTPAGDLLLSDFALASLTIEKNFASTRRAIPGMLNTIAPEYVLGQTADQRADLYAVGAVLYQMVTGLPPFQGASLGEVAMKHVKSVPVSPRSLRADLPPAAEQVMLRALAKRPADRYSHARDLASAFRLAFAALQPAPEESRVAPALNILADLAGNAQATNEQTLAPRIGGLFDPKWRAQAQASFAPPAADAPQPEITESTVTGALLEEGTFAQFTPTELPTDEQPTNPVPQVQVNFGAGTELYQPVSQALPPAQENIPPVEFSPSADAAGNIKRTGLLGLAKFQQTMADQISSREQDQSGQMGVGSTLQLADSAASNTEALWKFTPSQQASPTGMLNTLAQLPGGGNETGAVKLTESVKIVQVPVAGQPGRFMTGYLPMQPQEPLTSTTPKRLSARMRIVSIILAILIVAAGSGIFLVIRGHANQANNQPKAQATPNAQASAIAQASATANANIIFSDSLSQNSNQWPVGSKNWYTCTFENGAYHIANHDKAKSAPVLLPGKTLNGPFTYTLTMDQTKGDQTAPNNLFGMMLYATVQNPPGKPQVDKFYAFEILNTASGQYQFWKYDNSKGTSSAWNLLWSKNFGKEFKQGSGTAHTNTVKIIATGKMFTFIINHKQVGTWKDHSFSNGSVGMLVNLDGADVAFSDLLLTYS
jgi:serine/threonine protein kinase